MAVETGSFCGQPIYMFYVFLNAFICFFSYFINFFIPVHPGHDLGCGRAVGARTIQWTQPDTGVPIGASKGQIRPNPDVRLGSRGGVGLIFPDPFGGK